MLEIKNTEVAFLGRAVKACTNAYKVGNIDTRWSELSLIGESDFARINSDESLKEQLTDVLKSVKFLGSNGNNQPKQCHDHFLSMISVAMDIKYPRYISCEMQRYHWFEIVSSQSTMHTVTKVMCRNDYKDHFNDDVSLRSIEELRTLCLEYNFLQNHNKFEVNLEKKQANSDEIEDLFHRIKSNLPEGYELWMTVHTNYLQLVTMLAQRDGHRLRDWKPFVDWVHTLPLFDFLTSRGVTE